MLKLAFLSTTVLVLSMTVSLAETYRCKMADGRFVYTDQPGNSFVDCQVIEDGMQRGSFNVVPVEDGPPTKNNEAPETAKVTIGEGGYKSWVEKAQALVSDYEQEVRARYHETLAADQRLAIQAINKITQDKQDMLNELSTTNLSNSEKKSIEKILDQISSE